MRTRNQFNKSLLAAAVALTLPATGFAQAKLEEVIVTATKRAESTQDIPMAVEAVTGEQLTSQGIIDFATLAEQIPNFYVGDGVVTTNINMRGTGSGGDRSFEQSVGMFIDDIYMPRSRQYRSPFFDAERVEVLRGPQAVLFGLNSTAGAVSVHTRRTRPGDGFTADVTLAYETEYEGTKAEIAIGGSPTESLGLRFSAQLSESDGYYHNDFTDDTEGDREAELYRLSAVWEPTDRLTIDAKYEWVDYDQSGNHGEVFGALAPIFDGGDGELNWRRNVDAGVIGTYPVEAGGTPNVEPGLYQEIETLAISVEYLLGEHALTGIFGYSDMEYSFGLDLDTMSGGLAPSDINAGVPFLDASITPETYEQTSFELRLTSPGGQTIDYLVGVYYQDSELFNANESAYYLDTVLPAFGLCDLVGLCGLQWGEYQSNDMEMTSELWSVYGNLTWNMSDSLRLIAGARYTDEDKEAYRDGACKFYDIASGAVTAEGALFCTTFYAEGRAADRNSSNFMPEFVLQWDAGENSMIYGKVGTSAKSGGFATASTILPESWEYDDEKVITYEAGYKGRFGGGVAEFNAVVFRSEYEDLQVNSFITDGGRTVGIISNAGETVNQGIELDGRWAATDWLILGGSAAFLDAEYTDYKTGACSQTSGLTNPCDLTGETPPYAPEFSGTVFADLTVPMGSVNFVGNLTAAYSDGYFTDGTLDPVGKQGSYTRVSGRLGIAADDNKWDISVIGRNLTDEVVLDVTQPLFGPYLGYIGAPRTIAIQGTYRFGQ